MRGLSQMLIGGLTIALAVLACDEDQLFDPEAMGVEIEAGVEESFATGEDVVILNVENLGSDTVFYHGAWLERREDSGWERFDAPDATTGQPIPLESGSSMSVDRVIRRNSFDPPSTLPAGEYRFIVRMSEDENSAGDAIASNTFRIKNSYDP